MSRYEVHDIVYYLGEEWAINGINNQDQGLFSLINISNGVIADTVHLNRIAHVKNFRSSDSIRWMRDLFNPNATNQVVNELTDKGMNPDGLFKVIEVSGNRILVTQESYGNTITHIFTDQLDNLKKVAAIVPQITLRDMPNINIEPGYVIQYTGNWFTANPATTWYNGMDQVKSTTPKNVLINTELKGNAMDIREGDRVKLNFKMFDKSQLITLKDLGIKKAGEALVVAQVQENSVTLRSRRNRKLFDISTKYIKSRLSLLSYDTAFQYNSVDNKFEFNLKDFKLTNKQKFFVFTLMKAQRMEKAIDYINSTLGEHNDGFHRRPYVCRGEDDTLAQRPDLWFYRKLNEAFDMKSRDHKTPGGEKGEYIGVEIECLIPNHVSMEDIQKEMFKLKVKGITNVSDGSIKDDDGHDMDEENEDSEYYGREFRILTKFSDLSNLENFLKILNAKGAYVNTSCGMHVHLDCRDVSKVAAMTRADRLVKALPYLTAMVPPSRRTNHFCQYGKSVERDRYYMVNTTSLSKHGTIEVRLHSGTTNFTKIANWIKILHKITRTQVRGDFPSLGNFFKRMDLPTELQDYMVDRIKAFNKPEKIMELLGVSVTEQITEPLVQDEISEEEAA